MIGVIILIVGVPVGVILYCALYGAMLERAAEREEYARYSSKRGKVNAAGRT